MFAAFFFYNSIDLLECNDFGIHPNIIIMGRYRVEYPLLLVMRSHPYFTNPINPIRFRGVGIRDRLSMHKA